MTKKLEKQNPFVILFVDVDDFKFVNDTFGHSVGDCVLKEISKLLQTALPRNASIARFGGDEFIICIDDVVKLDEIRSYLDNLLHGMKHELSCGVTVSISIGLSFYPSDGSTRKALFHAADIALYNAKRRGKKTYMAAEQ